MEKEISWFNPGAELKIRYGVWRPAKARGTVVVLGGRGEFLEKYEETIHDLLDRDFLVFSFDWRGQGLSSRETGKSILGHIDSFDEYLKDLEAFIDGIVVPGIVRPVVMLAHSMGGHLGLRYLAGQGDLFEKAVMTSPMVALKTNPIPPDLLYNATRIAVVLGLGKKQVPFTSGRNAYKGPFEGNILTSSRRRFDRNRDIIEKKPELLVDSLSFGWLKAAFDSMNTINQPGFSDKIKTPLMIIAAGNDRVVSNPAIKHLAESLPDANFHWLEKAEHEILQEKDSIREKFWFLFDQYIG